MKFKTFMEQMVQKKNISVEYGRNDVVTKLTVNGKLVKGFSLSIPEYSKEIWDSVKEVNNVRF